MNNILLHCEHTYSGISTLITTFYASSVTTDEAYMCVCVPGCFHTCLDLCPEAMFPHLISIEASLQGQKCPSKAKRILFFLNPVIDTL